MNDAETLFLNYCAAGMVDMSGSQGKDINQGEAKNLKNNLCTLRWKKFKSYIQTAVNDGSAKVFGIKNIACQDGMTLSSQAHGADKLTPKEKQVVDNYIKKTCTNFASRTIQSILGYSL